jgi:Tol biopolymer transport system component
LTTKLWTVALDGGTPTQLYESACCVAWHRPPAWSPDGQWIALGVDLEDRPSESGVFLVRPDGSEIRRATDMPLQPVWQPIPEG